MRDKRVANEWADRGLPYFAKPKKPKKEPPALQGVFKKLPPEEILKALRERGFTSENSQQIWEGKAIRKEISSLIGNYGSVYRLKVPGV